MSRTPGRFRGGRAMGILGGVVGLGILPLPSEPAASAADHTISRIAGTHVAGFSGDGGPATRARINAPRDSDVCSDGTIYVADTYNNRIRKIAPDGTISTIVGTGAEGSTGDGGPATAATITWPHDVAIDDRTGVLYVADSNNNRIRQVTPDGIIRPFAGTGRPGFSGDGGVATRAHLKYPKSIAVFGDALYIADSINNRIRRVDLATRIITTVAGNGRAGYSGDGGPAKAATFNAPQRIAFDGTGNLYIADTLNNVIRRIDVARTVTTIVGTGTAGSSGDGGPGTSARIDTPRGLAIDDAGTTLYLSDTGSDRVRMLDLSTGVISAFAGTGVGGYSGDGGPANMARLNDPRGLSMDNEGHVVIADAMNDVLRLV